jgi:hypothetical protein
MVGMIAPIVKERFAAITRAAKFGVYPKVVTADITRSRVAVTTRSGSLRHLDTVAVETPAFLATSSKVGADRSFDITELTIRFHLSLTVSWGI